MVIKNYALELGGYEESRIAVLIHVYIVGKRLYIILNSIFDSLVIFTSIIRA